MQVFAAPTVIPVPELFVPGQQGSPDFAAYEAKCDAYIAAVGAHLRANGFTGPNTGKVYRIGHADGYAQYIVAEAPPRSRPSFALVHLPLMDAWDSPWAQRVTKKDVLAYINRRPLFGSARIPPMVPGGI
jgi:hypothetical protein